MAQGARMCNHRVAMTDMPASVTREIVLPAPPEEVWPALTEAEQLAGWFAPEVEIDPRPGGAAVFRWEDEARRAVIEEVEEPRRLSFRWGDAAESSCVEFTLDEVEEGTLLRVRETAEAAAPLPGVVAMLGRGAGWQRVLGRLSTARARNAAAA